MSQHLSDEDHDDALDGATRYALHRQMHTALGRLAWLLEFARRPIGTGLRGRELADLQEQILAFCLWQAGPHFYSGRVRRLGSDMMLKLRETVQIGIYGFVNEPRLGWLLPQVRRLLVREPATGAGRVQVTGDPEQLFPHFAAELVAAEGARIHACVKPGCSNLFVRRKRGAYCSKRCSQYVRTKRYREGHPPSETKMAEASDSRHRDYERGIKAKLGPNIRVRRMRRGKPK